MFLSRKNTVSAAVIVLSVAFFAVFQPYATNKEIYVPVTYPNGYAEQDPWAKAGLVDSWNFAQSSAVWLEPEEFLFRDWGFDGSLVLMEQTSNWVANILLVGIASQSLVYSELGVIAPFDFTFLNNSFSLEEGHDQMHIIGYQSPGLAFFLTWFFAGLMLLLVYLSRKIRS